MFPKNARRLLPVLMGAAFAATPLAQPGRRPQFSTRTDLITVDVLVTKGGAPVTGLTAANFQVKDNGLVQDLQTASSEAVQLDVTWVVGPAERRIHDQRPELSRAGEALRGALEASDHVTVVPFGGPATPIEVSSHDAPTLGQRLDSGSTQRGFKPMRDAVVAALLDRHDHPGRHLIVLFSDGSDGRSWSTREQVLDLVKRTDSVVYVLKPDVSRLSSWITPGFVEDLAAESGGRVIDPDSANLRDTLVALLRESRSRYLLTYVPRQEPTRGWHRLEVTLNGANGRVAARRGYYVQ